MATKGTIQYNVWKAKYQAALLRKAGVQSIFSEEECNALISTVVKEYPKTKEYSLDFFKANVPKGLNSEVWAKAAVKATKGGSKSAGFGAVRAIYKVYINRQKTEVA